MTNLCPQAILNCFRAICFCFSSSNQKQGMGRLEYLQQEEFQFTPTSKVHPDLKHAKMQQRQAVKSHDEHQQNLSFKLNLQSSRDTHNDEKTNLLQEQPEASFAISNFDFKLNLEPYDQYYPLLESKTKNISALFASNTKNILSRNSKSQVSIEEIETLNGFKMIISYRLPCSYSFFARINKDQSLVANLNPVIAATRIIETIRPNLTINHLAFKKFMLLEPRYFHYLKYENSSSNGHWEICVSLKSRPESEPVMKECDLTSISCYEQRREGLVVNSYLQVDLKSNLRASKVVLRVYQELASYLDNLYDYVAQNYREEDI